jgi:argininosuccinate lyase
MDMTLWGGRFTGKPDPLAWTLNASLSFDRRLALQDVRGSIAWAGALETAGVLTHDECSQICVGLNTIQGEFGNGDFKYLESDEDIHTSVERRLGELIGPSAGKLHTGRSRNDQVATDLRLWLLEAIQNLDTRLGDLQTVLVERAESDLDILLPGYTHMQRAQPILLGHWWLSHFWPFQRDRERLLQVRERTASLPLGSGALAGTAFPVDRAALANALGFSGPSPNSLDAVSDRDFAVEFLFCAALAGTHLSKLAESVVLFSSAEFGFFELSDAFSTGSSLMPQKKNPDVFELARGKAGTLLGYLMGLMATLKGLPSAYDKDLQEDKVPVFNAYDTLMAILPVLAAALRSLSLHPERMRTDIDPAMMATDLADALAQNGLPFRQAHNLVGQAIKLAGNLGKPLHALSQQEFQTLDPPQDVDISGVFNPQKSVARRNATGGTALEAVRIQLQSAKELTQKFTTVQ